MEVHLLVQFRVIGILYRIYGFRDLFYTDQ